MNNYSTVKKRFANILICTTISLPIIPRIAEIYEGNPETHNHAANQTSAQENHNV